MKKNMILGVCAVVSGIVLFGGGFFCGLKFFAWNYNITALTEARIALMPLVTNIEALDRKDYDSLRTSLNLRIDGEVLKIYNTIEESKNKEDIDKAKKALSRLAKHRQNYPPVYPAYLQKSDNEKVYKHVDAILAQFIDYK
jgi:hypothetical protein